MDNKIMLIVSLAISLVLFPSLSLAISYSNYNITPVLDISYFGQYNFSLNISSTATIVSANVTIATINGDGASCWDYYVNGSCASSPLSYVLTNTTKTAWSKNRIYPDQIYPEIFFVPSEITWYNSPSNRDIWRQSYYLFNFTNQFAMEGNMSVWIEFNAVPKSTGNSNDLMVYIVSKDQNLSYFTADWRSNPQTQLLASIPRSATFHHSHTSNSSHMLVPLTTNMDGTIGTGSINISGAFWVVLYQDSVALNRGWNLRYHNLDLFNSSEHWYVANRSGGGTWNTPIPVQAAPDVHIHFARRNEFKDSVNFTVVAALDNGTTSISSQQFFFGDLPNIAPNPVAVTYPVENTSYFGTEHGVTDIINVTWTQANDPNTQDNLSYTLTLMDASGAFNATLISASSLLFHEWNISSVEDGQYLLTISVCDDGTPSLCANSTMAGNFSIQSVPDPICPAPLIGSNTTADPCMITNCTGLQAMSQARANHFALGSDIDCQATITWNDGFGFIPAGNSSDPFVGSLDGRGRTITGLTINRTSEDYVGMFGYLSGLGAWNITLHEVSISGEERVGAFAGRLIVPVWGIHVDGNVSGDSFVGGVVGGSLANISSCSADVNVSGISDYVGGLVGGSSGDILHSHSSGIVTTHNLNIDASIGGLAGVTTGTVLNCSSSSNVSGLFAAGGLVGSAQGAIRDSFATGDVFITDSYAGGLVGSLSGNIYNSYATGDVVANGGYGGGLVGVSEGGNITDCNASGTIVGSNGRFGGLVGATSGLVNNSFAIGQVNGSGYSKIGGLVGGLSGRVESSYSSGYVEGQDETGGLVGYCTSCTIFRSHSTSPTYGTRYFTGGLVGLLSSGIVNQSYSDNPYVSGNEYVGGLVGTSISSTIMDSYSKSDTHATGNYVGGLVGTEGYNPLSIIRCYSSGDVTIGNDDGTIGGLVGYMKDEDIQHSFTVSSITTFGSYLGSIVGRMHGEASINDSYWYDGPGRIHSCYTPSISGETSESYVANCIPINDSVSYFYDPLNAVFDTWDFSHIWAEQNNDYPILAWRADSQSAGYIGCVDLLNSSTFQSKVAGNSVVGFNVSSSITLCPGTYSFPASIIVLTIITENVTIDCDGAGLRGEGTGDGINSIYPRTHIINCDLRNFSSYSISLSNGEGMLIENTFADDGAMGIIMSNVTDSVISNSTGLGIGDYGIYIVESQRINITNCTAISGLSLEYVNHSRIINTTSTAESMYALRVYGSFNVTIEDSSFIAESNDAAYVYNSPYLIMKRSLIWQMDTDYSALVISDGSSYPYLSDWGYYLNNTFRSEGGTGASVKLGEALAANNTFLNNTLRSDVWVIHYSPDLNHFNDSGKGNIYLLANGTGSWLVYDINDTDNDTWADSGTYLPFGPDTVSGRWSDGGYDYFPYVGARPSVQSTPAPVASSPYSGGGGSVYIPKSVCGDKSCSSAESCLTCPADCGACDDNSTSGGGIGPAINLGNLGDDGMGLGSGTGSGMNESQSGIGMDDSAKGNADSNGNFSASQSNSGFGGIMIDSVKQSLILGTIAIILLLGGAIIILFIRSRRHKGFGDY